MLGAILRTTISNGRGNVTTSLLATRRSNDSFVRCYHMTRPVLGFEEFYDDKKNPNDVILVGRSWTVPDLRRKVSSTPHPHPHPHSIEHIVPNTPSSTSRTLKIYISSGLSSTKKEIFCSVREKRLDVVCVP